MKRQLTTADIARAAVERTVYGYAEEYIYLENESKFSFADHNYLIGIYQDNHPYQVIEKSAQMGGSIYAMIKSLFVCDKLGKNVIYFFPTDTDVMDFSKTRVGPIIKNSPHLAEITDSEALGLRQVGRGWLYMRGMRSKVAMKSVPSDMNVYDELDEVPEGAEALADQRLNHSTLRWRLKLSTPTYENYGIDREFKASDQNYWNLVCQHCQTRTITEFTFPDCVKRLTPNKCVLICRRCKRELDTQFGEWRPEKPQNGERIRGYHLCGLYSKFLDLSEMMYEYDSGRRRDEFMRSKLGFPYTSEGFRLNLDMIQRCYENYEMHTDRHTYMGVDQKGDMLHIIIRKPNRLMGRSEVILVGKVKEFGQLDEIMRRYDVDLCVVDGTPNQHSARDFSRRFPGRVYLCYYQPNQKGEYAWRELETTTGTDFQVVVNRTEALDAMCEQVQRREVAFPKPTKEVEEVADHLTNMARENIEDDEGTVIGAEYKRLGADHYAHAMTYSLIAESKYGKQTPTSIVVKSPFMSAVIRPRSIAGRY